MDHEALKAGVSLLAATVAVVSAILAHRAKVQTRRDLFDAERNSLILVMAENDRRGEHIALQEAFARGELERIRPKLAADALSEHADWLESIPNAELLKQTLQGRNYTQDKLDLLEYDEEGLSILRQMNRGEQINARLLASEAYDLIFSRIDAFVERCEKGAVAR